MTRTDPSGERARERRALLAAACGLLLTAAVLLCSLPAAGGGTGYHGGGPQPPERAAQPARLGQQDGGPATDGEREVCDDGYEAAASYPPSRAGGPAVDRILSRGYLSVGVDLNSYLWGYREPGSTGIVGFDIELVEAIAASLFQTSSPEDHIRYRAIPTNQREAAVMNRTVDMVVRTMSITCERWSNVAFSSSYFETRQQLVAPGGSGITGYDESLAGRTVCSADGSTAQELLQRESYGAELVFRPHQLDCLVLVQLGEADALMTDAALAAAHIAQDPEIELVGEPAGLIESYGVAMRQEDVDLVRWVNDVLEEYIAGGGWDEAYRTWLSDYLGDPGTSRPGDLRHRSEV